MPKSNYVIENAPLSRFGVLVAQLESIVASAAHKPPDPIMCFDLLSDLISAIEDEPKESILLWQRKCEDALYSLLVLGARRPVRHLASVAMAKTILKGDAISIYSRVSSLQGFLADGKKNDAQKVAGAAQCLGELYLYFGRRIISGILETTHIVAKLLKFTEDFVRQEALHMLQNALEGSGGNAASAAYSEAFRVITRIGVGDKSLSVRIRAARCLKAFANIGGPGLGTGELEYCLSYCVKALDDPVQSVRDSFADALGALLALGMNPEAQVQPRGKGHVTPKKLESCLQKHLATPFAKASGPRSKEIRVGVALSWVYFLQAIRLKYHHPDSELQNYVGQVMDMLGADPSIDAQALACVLYILRVGVTDQMTEPTQRGFSVFLGKQLLAFDSTPSMRVAILRTLSYVLKTLGEVPLEFKEVLDDTVVAAVSHDSPLVRVEAALTLRTLAEVDPSCVGGLISYAVTMLNAAKENVSFEKGANFKEELGNLHGQAAVLASLVSISRKLPLGYPGRLPMSVLDVCKNLLTRSSRSPIAAAVEKEAGWALLSSLIASMSKEELQSQVFDILALWASTFSGKSKVSAVQMHDAVSEIGVWSAAIDALTSFVKRFISSDAENGRILVQPVLLYLNCALSFLSQLSGKEHADIKAALDLFVVRVLINYQALSDPSLYKIDHSQIVQICTTPFREPSGCEESSCLRMLLDKRDAWLGPWTPGRDWFEDELRSFQGGKSGTLTCVWEDEPPSFPQPETISKMLVNQMLLCFGTMFAAQDSRGMVSFLGIIDQCLKAGKKQAWRASSITNICVGLLAGLKILLAQRSEPLGMEILNAAQSIFQSILAEGDICTSQRRASAEGLGLLARLGNDAFTARMTKQFFVDATNTVDSNYAGSIALAVGCIHCSAGGMALSSMVPTTVNVMSSLAKSSISSLQIWSLHGLLLTIESSGLSYVSQVQATLGLAMEILLSEESGLVDLQQAVARLINAIVAVIGPELAPGSIFFSRCKSAVAEISCQETATLLESVRFTQQLVLFAPQAVTVHSHLLNLLPTLSSRQPTLRHLALSTLRHLIEKDPASVIQEQIEETLFHMLDEETDAEIGNLAQTTIMRLLYASCPSHPSHWLSICHNMVLSTSRLAPNTDNNSLNDSSSSPDGEKTLNLGDDDENMVSGSRSSVRTSTLDFSNPNFKRDKHLRYRTRVFAAECLSHLPEAVGENPAHFDLSLARAQRAKNLASGDWLVLQLQELISLAYQISTIQFENMRPVGVSLLCTIIDKFAAIPDPELPDHLLLEQYQAQLVSAVRSALDSFSGPMLLEAGLQLATKMLMSGIVSRDQAAVKRIFSLISRPLNEFNDLYFPSYAEWVSCKIKIRLLTVHASLKCYMFAFLRRQGDEIPEEYLALLPLFSKSSSILGIYWLSLLKDCSFVHFHLNVEHWKPFLDGIQSPVVATELQPCLEEAWPVILQALVLDAVPANSNMNGSSPPHRSADMPTSGYSMVELRLEDFKFLWGFLLLVLFQEQDVSLSESVIPLSCTKSKITSDILADDSSSSKLYDFFFPVLQFMSTEKFFSAKYLTLDACRELLQVFLRFISREDSWDGLVVSTLSQIIQNCPRDFLEVEDFACLASELCLTSLFKFLLSCNADSQFLSSWEKTITVSLKAGTTLLERFEPQMQLKSLLPFLLIGYKCIGEASTEAHLSNINGFLQSVISSLKILAKLELGDDDIRQLASINTACLDAACSLTRDCIKAIHFLENKMSSKRKLLLLKLAFAIEQIFSYANLAFVFESPGQKEESNPVLSKLLQCSIRQVQDVITNSDIQIQAVGLQVVKVILHKGISAGDTSFSSFFAGELVGDFFIIIQKILEMPINREAIAVGGECLKILVLLQTLPKGRDYQKGLIRLLFEAILMIFSATDNSFSQEANGLRSISVNIVSQLAQTPSSAALIKDLLLEMSAAKRQQLQDMIRASVVQDQNPKSTSSSGPPLVIKLPSHTQQNRETNPLPVAPAMDSNDSDAEEDEEEEDDDWDTFQSFPASGNVTAPTPDSIPSTSNDGSIDADNEENSTSFNIKDNVSVENEERVGVVSLKEESHGPPDGDEISTSPQFSMKENVNIEDQDLDESMDATEATSGSQVEESSGLTDGHESSTSLSFKDNDNVEYKELDEDTSALKIVTKTQPEESYGSADDLKISPSSSKEENITIEDEELDEDMGGSKEAGSPADGHESYISPSFGVDEKFHVGDEEPDEVSEACKVADSNLTEGRPGSSDGNENYTSSSFGVNEKVRVGDKEPDEVSGACEVADSSLTEGSRGSADGHGNSTSPSFSKKKDVCTEDDEPDQGTSAANVGGNIDQADELHSPADDHTRGHHSDNFNQENDELLSSPQSLNSPPVDNAPGDSSTNTAPVDKQ